MTAVARRLLRHSGPLLLLAALSVLWTWPLVLHLKTHLTGVPGDNFSFVWNVWWMRETLGAPGSSFLHSDYLFAPFGISLVNHSHTALASLAGATVLRPLSPAEAENVIVLATVWLAAAAMYGLAFDITRDRLASLAGAIIFAGSPHMASKLVAGHLELVSIWVFPLFALAFRRALRNHSLRAAAGAGVVLAAAAYSAYYYVVYLGLFAATYLVGWSEWVAFGIAPRLQTRRTALLKSVALVLLCATLALAVWIVASGGATVTLGSTPVSLHHPQNPLTMAWAMAFAWASLQWRLVVRLSPLAPGRLRQIAWMSAILVFVFVIATLPLTRATIDLVRQGGYSSQRYFWRSAPGGVDLVTPFLGNPFHPIVGRWSSRAYAWAHVDQIESIAWLGVIPLAVLFAFRRRTDQTESRLWWLVLGSAAVWAAGPILLVTDFDTGLRLPQMLARFLPVVANARIPGRAMVLVYLAMGVLVAQRLSATGGWQRIGGRWMVPVLIVADYLNAPIPLSKLDQPIAYQQLALIPDRGSVCEAPFGIGDGLGGVGSQDRRVLYYATLHGHPLVGGFAGRFPPGYTERYAQMPFVGDLLRLSAGERPLPAPLPGLSPCAYVVLNRDRASPALIAYVQSAPTLQWLAGDGHVDLYRQRE